VATPTASSPKAEATRSAAPDSQSFAPSWFLPARPAPTTPSDEESDSPTRLWTHLMRARVLVAMGLLLLQGWGFWVEGASKWMPLALCAIYGLGTLAVLRWSQPQSHAPWWSLRWSVTVWADVAAFAALQLWAPGNVNYTPLFVLPVLLAAISGSLVLALGSAAAATWVLLAEAGLGLLHSPELYQTRFLQAAFTSTGLFLVALLAHQLAKRVAREQTLASKSQALAQAQADVNTLIVNGLNEGVLVVDDLGKLWHANAAACAMLGATRMAELPQTPGWGTVFRWALQAMHWPELLEDELTLPQPQGQPARLFARARVTSLSPALGSRPVCVLFLEDLREVEARIRNEKLAAMGRMSAAVAHDIRNPLAAISQANALLAEDNLPPSQQKLVHMVDQNARRIARTVDDILGLVRGQRHAPHADNTPLLAPLVQNLVTEWAQHKPQGERLSLNLQAPQQQVHFEPEHLRRVLNNLLDNAAKHASPEPGAIQVRLAPHASPQNTQGHSVNLTVWSHAPELERSVQNHLFEPFFSSDSRSTGLGLYICRELCERYHAELLYERQTQGTRTGNAFCIRLPVYEPRKSTFAPL
jgi:two-component system, NtrC family, sensor histidine kinase PilS